MNLFRVLLSRTGILAVIVLFVGFAAAQAQSVNVGWNFGDTNAVFDTGTPVNFSVGNMSIANSWGTVTAPVSTTSASSGYAGSSGTGNIGNAVHNEAFSTGTSPYTTVTFTPAAGYSLQITKFDFGLRSTATGASSYALYSSVDNYAAPIYTGTDLHDSTWRLKTNPSFALNGAANTPVTLRLYTYGGGSTAGSGTINTRLDDIVITVAANTTVSPTNPAAVATASSLVVLPGQNVLLTVTVTPGSNPTSTGLSVTGDLSAIGGSPTQAFSGAGNVFTYNATIPANLTFGSKLLNFSVLDAQARTASASLNLAVRGNVTIFHTNDTHARVTPHKWVVPQHTTTTTPLFEDVGGVAYMGAKVLELTSGQPDALVLDGGDISEGNPIGDWNGPGTPVGTYGDGTIVEYYKMLDAKLKTVAGRGGRGLDAMVVGNHDIRDITYLNNLKDPSVLFPVISMNICAHGTHTPYFAPYVILNVNGNKIGVVGYTTESADSPESAVNNLIDVVKCDWSSTDSTKIHFADYVNELRNNQGCTMVILLTHMGHSGLCTVTGANPTPILVDTPAAVLPEIVVSGHWHTYCETVWQPTSLNYKTIFTEAGSFQHYVGELRVNGLGKYISSNYSPLKNSAITPDPDIAAMIQTRKDQYAATNPTYGVDQIIGYTADNLLLDNYMKWWSADEYPWSGNNTAGNWICDAVQWKAAQLFGTCDLSLEAGGGVRSDIVAGPIKYTNIYETFPWADDTIEAVHMTGQQIWDFFKAHNCDAAMSAGWHVTAHDGVPTEITYNGSPVNLAQTYTVAINNYMYLHDTVDFSVIDPTPQTSTYLARTALVEFTSQYTQGNPYSAGPPRYTLNTDFSGGYRGVVTLISDNNSRTTFDCAFIRLLSANAETLAHRGTPQVPTALVNADGSVIPTNRLAENQLYRSYLGFRTGLLHPGDIVETWGKGAFFDGNPEFVDQEGIQADGVEFKVVGHDDSLAKPIAVPDIATALDDDHKNHYVKFLAKKTGTNTVADQNGTVITVWNVDAFVKKTLPGNVNDLLVITGVPTSESFAMRLRSDNVVVASTLGITNFPATPTVVSHMDQVPASVTGAPLTLTATASVYPGTVYSLTPVADSTISSGNHTTNSGTSTTLFMQSGSGSFGNERDWLKFDLSALPAGLAITNAQLQLFCWGAATTALPVAVSGGDADSWTETGITWDTQPTFGSALATQTLIPGSVNLSYDWDVTSFAQTKFAGNKMVSLVAKPVTENNSTDITYKFDSKEFGSNAPVLQVTAAPTGPAVTVAQVQFFYRYSSDNSTWGAWTATGTDTTTPYSASFTFPQGFGYYEFYSVATDSNSIIEPTPIAAQTAAHYTAVAPYTTAAIVTLSNLTQTYDGTSKSATVTTIPAGLSVTVTYDGSPTSPTLAMGYSVIATVTSAGFTGSAGGTMTIAQAGQTINFPAIPAKHVGEPAFSPGAAASSGLPVSYQSDNLAVATISGSTINIVGVGTANITASQTGNNGYLAAAPVTQTLTVNPAAAGADSDVPLMPWWALALLAVLLFAVAASLLSGRHRQTGHS